MHNSTHKTPLIFMAVILAILFQSPFMGIGNAAESEWKLYKEENGIKGYEHGVKDSDYLETRAETIIEAPMEVVLEVLMDIRSFPEWMHACVDAVPLEQKDILNRILYFRQDAPWPTKDRDAIIHSVTSMDYENPGSITKLESIDNYEYKESPENTTRMIKYKGEFDLRMLDRNRTRMTYTAFSEPGGFAPAGIAAGVIRKVSFNTTKNMIEMAKQKKYIEKAQTGVAKKDIEQAIKEGRIKFAAVAK